jgi:hypothetical protein
MFKRQESRRFVFWICSFEFLGDSGYFLALEGRGER